MVHRSVIEAQEIFGLDFDLAEFTQAAYDGLESDEEGEDEDDEEDDENASNLDEVGITNPLVPDGCNVQ